MELSADFWRGRRVLLTGHTGFKGGWLALWLQRVGAQVVGFSSGVPSEPSLFQVADIGAGMESVEGDVRDLAAVDRTFEEHRPEIVIHMAAQALVRHSFVSPVETYAINVMGTVHVLDAAHRTDGVRAVVNVTSDKCYENREWVWGYREHEAMGGHDPYSSSKGCAELVTSAYRRSFGGPAVASARAGNVIGGGDWGHDRLIPDIMRAALAGEEVDIRHPQSIRPWQHVLNPLSGYLLLAQALWDAPEHADGWNFGPADEDARPVSWIADRLAELWPGQVRWKVDPGPHPHEAQYLKLDSSKARMRLGWTPRWQLADALAAIVEWYRALAGGVDMRAVTLAQIEAFEAGRRMPAAGAPPRRTTAI